MQSWLTYNLFIQKNTGAKERKIYQTTNTSWDMNINKIYIWGGVCVCAIVANITLSFQAD